MDLSRVSNDEIERLVAGFASTGAADKPADEGLAWDDGLFDSFGGDDFLLADDPAAFTLPTFPLSHPAAAFAQPYHQHQHHQQQFISPDLLSFAPPPSATAPSLIGGAGSTHGGGGHRDSTASSYAGQSSSSCYSSSCPSTDGAADECAVAHGVHGLPITAIPHHHHRRQQQQHQQQAFSIAPPPPSDYSGHSSIDSVSPAPAPTAARPGPTPKKAAAAAAAPASAGGAADGRPKQPYKRTKTGCLCCRQRRVRCCETKPECKRCRNAGRECVWPTAENPASTRKVRGGEVTLPSGVVVGARKKAGSDAAGGGGSKRSERGTGKAERKTEPKKVDASSVSTTAADDHMSLASTAPPPASTLSPGFSTASSDLSPCPSEDDQLSTDGGLALALEQPQQKQQQPMEVDADVGPAAAGAGTDQWLMPWFPTSEARGLILHFCQTSGSLLMSNPPPVSPLLATLLPLALSAPRDTSAPADALRTTLLTIGATHQAYLLARASAPHAVIGQAVDLAVSLRREARTLQAAAAAGALGKHGAGGETTLVRLAGAVMGSAVDVMLGGHGYAPNLALGLELVKSAGGPDAFLASSSAPPIDLGDGSAVDPARLLLEILAVHELFAGLVEGAEATLIADGAWWTAGAGVGSYHKASVENHFGTTRTTLSLLARTNALMIRASQASGRVPETSVADDCLFHDDAATLAFLREATGLSGCSTPVGPAPTTAADGLNEPDVSIIRKDVGVLLADVERELNLARALGFGRLKNGSEAYLHAIKILVLRHVFGVGRTEARVQQAALAVLEACSSAISALQPAHLTWPMLVASTQTDGAARPWAVALFDGLRTHGAFDVDSAEKLARDVWARLDRGNDWADWRAVVVDLDMKVLLT